MFEEKLNNIRAIIIPPRSVMNYHTFTFPVISKKKIRKILPREIQKYTDSQEEIVFDFQLGSKIIEKSWSTDLNKKFPKGEWRTINGARVFINGSKVVAGLDGFNKMIDESSKDKKSNNDRVSHSRFGDGTVLKRGGGNVTVKFDDPKIGKKELLEKFAKLTKIGEVTKESNKKIKENNKLTPTLERKPKKVQKNKNKPKKVQEKGDSSVNVKKETSKAYLLEKNGVEFWVQKRWFNKDNNILTPKGKETYKEGKELKEKYKDENKGFDVKKETEKAYLLNKDGIEFWTPKSWYNDNKLNTHGMENYLTAKENNRPYKMWESKDNNLFRGYSKVGKGYIQISVKERSAQGYYETHRAAKGETGFYTFFIKDSDSGLNEKDKKKFLEDVTEKTGAYHINYVEK
jgi:hypothetical protein